MALANYQWPVQNSTKHPADVNIALKCASSVTKQTRKALLMQTEILNSSGACLKAQ